MMVFPREIIELVCCALLAASSVLVVVRRGVRAVEWRAALAILATIGVTVAYLVILGTRYGVPPDLLISVLLVELGVCAHVYDRYRTFHSVSGSLRNIGSIYLFVGVIGLLSRPTRFPMYLWAIPVLFFSCGYFFFKRRRGAANLCKGLGVLVSVAFMASILYDIREDSVPGAPHGYSRGRLSDIIRPSIVEKLNALNERVFTLEAEKVRLSSDLAGERAAAAQARTTMNGERAAFESKRTELEGALAAARNAQQEAQGALDRERGARAEAEQKLGEAKAAGKEGFSALDEKLALAAENLKKLVAENEALKAEREALKSTPPPGGMPAGQAGAEGAEGRE
ncbi:MAG: hypothetical protein NT045_08585 [Candidatus Aureabacteria bacterium]|nr:hypothetical protein [Candidatus Auribacterota bacterium]